MHTQTKLLQNRGLGHHNEIAETEEEQEGERFLGVAEVRSWCQEQRQGWEKGKGGETASQPNETRHGSNTTLSPYPNRGSARATNPQIVAGTGVADVAICACFRVVPHGSLAPLAPGGASTGLAVGPEPK
ncbi:hypothetical protein SKAU_G00099390 [Synaphobranchus kaupii]|uniref:Uncharacterized protein n=1 Tax=Synaphobranchus kaupii TaxID=118154 RepID=A0A9Q1FY94_SYNKA|nr:hypothetical protein SKAU_G00099390 [Synaphobranchus kaupii]